MELTEPDPPAQDRSFSAQHEFDANPELRELLARAAASPTVRRTRTRRAKCR